MPTDKKTAFAQGQGGLNLDPTAAAAASGTEAPPGTPAPTAPGAAAPAFGTKRPGETQTATGAFGSKATPFGGGGAAGAGGALSKPFGGAGAAKPSAFGGGAAAGGGGVFGSKIGGGALGGGAASGAGAFGAATAGGAFGAKAGGVFGSKTGGFGGVGGTGLGVGGHATWNEEWAKMYLLPSESPKKEDDGSQVKDNALLNEMEPELLDLVGSLQEHIHHQNELYKEVQRAIQEPKLAAYDETSVTARIRDLQQKLLMIDNKAFKSAEDIKTLGNKTEKMNEFVMLLQHEMLQPRDGYDHSASALVYRYYSEMVLEWEEKIGGYQALVTTLQRRLQPAAPPSRTAHDEIEGLQVLLHEQQRAFVQLSARLHEIHEKIEQACGRARPSLNLQTVQNEVRALYDTLGRDDQRAQPKRPLQPDGAAVQRQAVARQGMGGMSSLTGSGGLGQSPFSKVGAASAFSTGGGGAFSKSGSGGAFSKPGGGAFSQAQPGGAGLFNKASTSSPFGSKTPNSPTGATTTSPFGAKRAFGQPGGGVNIGATTSPFAKTPSAQGGGNVFQFPSK